MFTSRNKMVFTTAKWQLGRQKITVWGGALPLKTQVWTLVVSKREGWLTSLCDSGYFSKLECIQNYMGDTLLDTSVRIFTDRVNWGEKVYHQHKRHYPHRLGTPKSKRRCPLSTKIHHFLLPRDTMWLIASFFYQHAFLIIIIKPWVK